ncbi:hydrogenase maturation protease [Desulfoscipio gibsoniae]|uniref:Hydrogenase maturation protease n=1 Tax=Desulfoscipio gibsoniae DSM 7213 TaxID=767817 RepID=R4KJT6_9FIRM|nr:hydrogenase maturation protease [Desulfoscipio gibsoniae]AGL03458.1 hydrogenase maturation protease [Desulfoscipio gibsoniae DSM 7213]
MKNLQYQVLVLGLGNLIMSDDGLGVYAVNELKKQKWLPGAAILEVGTSIINYLEEISHAQNIIVIDAISFGYPPGKIYRFNFDDIDWPSASLDAHGISLPAIIAMARVISRLPAKVIIYGIEPAFVLLGSKLSEPVNKSLPLLIEKVSREVQMILE